MNRQHISILASVILALGGLTSLSLREASAENWPQWRGPQNDGISPETGLPVQWNKTENVAWRLPLPGPAGATPVVWGDQIFLTSSKSGGDLLLISVSTAGKKLWEVQVSGGDRTVRGDEGNSASPSPVTDGKHVWAFMANGVLGCYDFQGREVWKFNLQDRYGPFAIQFGMTSSPLLDGDRLYMQLLHSKAALVLALDKNTGEEVWAQNRPSDARAECEHSYASPVLYRDGKQAFLLTHGADYVVAHRLEDGKEIWRCGGLNPRGNYNPTLRFVASPVTAPGLIVVPSAKNGPVLGLSPDARGDISDTEKSHLWTRADNTPDVPSPLVHDGLVYLCRENGVLICMDAETGREKYQKRAFSDRYRASPVYGDGKIYITARGGVVTVVKAGPKFEILAQNDLGEPISASPAISNGRLYFRTFDALYAIGEAAK
jgi:outer membrane protein assembly factor BamB